MESYADIVLEAAAQELALFLEEVRADAADYLDASGRNYEGDTKGSLYTTPIERQGRLLVGAVGASADHALVVHEGRRPGKPMPPRAPIVRWLQKKAGLSLEEAERAQFPVRRKIARSGIPGTPFLRVPFEAKRPDLPGRIAQAGARALNARSEGANA